MKTDKVECEKDERKQEDGILCSFRFPKRTEYKAYNIIFCTGA